MEFIGEDISVNFIFDDWKSLSETIDKYTNPSPKLYVTLYFGVPDGFEYENGYIEFYSMSNQQQTEIIQFRAFTGKYIDIDILKELNTLSLYKSESKLDNLFLDLVYIDKYRNFIKKIQDWFIDNGFNIPFSHHPIHDINNLHYKNGDRYGKGLFVQGYYEAFKKNTTFIVYTNQSKEIELLVPKYVITRGDFANHVSKLFLFKGKTFKPSSVISNITKIK